MNMNRKARRALAKKARKRNKKMKKVENRMGNDFEAVKVLATRLEGIQKKVQTVHQAFNEIPLEELNMEKMVEDLNAMKDELQAVRKQGASMGPAVRKALEEAIAKSEEAIGQLVTITQTQEAGDGEK